MAHQPCGVYLRAKHGCKFNAVILLPCTDDVYASTSPKIVIKSTGFVCLWGAAFVRMNAFRCVCSIAVHNYNSPDEVRIWLCLPWRNMFVRKSSLYSLQQLKAHRFHCDARGHCGMESPEHR